MFNGLIKELASVVSFRDNYLTLACSYRPQMGDSIAVNGACLSVVKVLPDGFSLFLSHESRKSLAIENLCKSVHIEPAMRLSDKIEGHLIQGHVDAIGSITKIIKKDHSKDIYIKIPSHISHLIAKKGSVAIDGVSLTVGEVYEGGFVLTLIPISLKDTLFDTYSVNRRVNIETDLIARYLSRQSEVKANKIEHLGYLY